MDLLAKPRGRSTLRRALTISSALAGVVLCAIAMIGWSALERIDSWSLAEERRAIVLALTEGLLRTSDELQLGLSSGNGFRGGAWAFSAVAAQELPEFPVSLRPIGQLTFDQSAAGELALFEVGLGPDNGAPRREFDVLIGPLQILNQAVLDQVALRAGVDDLHLVQRLKEAVARLPVYDHRSRVVGWLGWQPSRPAFTQVMQSAPAIALGLAMCLIGFTALLTWLMRSNSALAVSRSTSEFLAMHDPLTGLANRVMFEKKLKAALALEYVAKTKVAVVSLDLDRFKEVNDTLGHGAGDQLMQEVARRLSLTLPEEATLARLGGDEFALVHPGIVSEGHADWICDSLINAFETPFVLSGLEVEVTASLGVALEEGGKLDASEMMRRADLALYSAKLSGRNRFEFYDPGMDRSRKDRRLLQAELRDALCRREGLFLMYQPIYDAQGGGMVGAEALVRWEHPSKGRVPPDLFIGVAEESGLIHQLGLWVLEEACRYAARVELPWIAVNVSPVQFRDPALANKILDLLGRYQLSASRLQLEITEGVLLQNSTSVQAALQKLRSAGVCIVLDDFGTGYSSISYLRTYSIDKLKIDRSFVGMIGKDAAIESIVRAMIEMSRSLHMEVTAEGVEEDQQRDALVQLGCDHLQGFLLSRPMNGPRLAQALSDVRSAA
jgi:diguanylate cyclase (GGDEF)-like protein